jgi:hypothetical protein
MVIKEVNGVATKLPKLEKKRVHGVLGRREIYRQNLHLLF